VASLNKVMLIGNVGADPEMRYTPNGNPVANFNMAVTYRRSSGDETANDTEWFTITCWNKTAEIVNQYLTKGQKVFVEGRFQSREYVGQDGIQRRAYEIIASGVTLLTSKSDAEAMASGNNTIKENQNEQPVKNEEIEGQEEKDLPW
tara:strand:- start:348 stop:788 length:441 start_codon:yes stop_codon:yes gene_type:complete